MTLSSKLLALVAVAGLSLTCISCFGNAHRVESCSECIGAEYCVEDQHDDLYCASPCGSDVNCAAFFSCVPLRDQEHLSDTVWVCMPDEFYTDVGHVYRVPGDEDCSSGGTYNCPTGMECLEDTSGAYDVYFCSDTCDYDSDCLSDCCYDTDEGEYCAPWYYCD
jgi:hypothetical protein